MYVCVVLDITVDATDAVRTVVGPFMDMDEAAGYAFANETERQAQGEEPLAWYVVPLFQPTVATSQPTLRVVKS